MDPNIFLQHFYSQVKHSMQSGVVLLVLLISLFVARSSPLSQLFVASFQSFTSLSVALFVASCPPFTFPRPIVCCQELESALLYPADAISGIYTTSQAIATVDHRQSF